MADPSDNLGVGGEAPPSSPLGGASLEDEEKAMRKGKGRMMVGMIVAVLLAIGAIVLVMISGGQDEAYSNWGRHINGVRLAHFDAFWGCTLQGANLADIRDNTELLRQIDVRATQGGARYATHVQETCMPKLAGLEARLDLKAPPDDMVTDVREIKDAAAALRSNWSDLVSQLARRSEDTFDEAAARTSVNNIAKAWYDYRRIHSRMNSKVREHLGR